MEPQKYLKEKLENCGQYRFSQQEKEILKEIGLKQFLFKQITRKKFRRWRLPDPARERIEEALDYCISKQKPIIFRFRFGGYKLWRLESAPEVDWAEFFTFAHYSEYLAPIVSAYKPGVKLLFMSDDVFVERLNNISKSDTEAYYQSFKKLYGQFKKHAPENFSIEMKRHSSLYKSMEELDKEFDEKMREIENDWREKQSQEKLKSVLRTSKLNIKWEGVQKLINLSEQEKQKKIERSAIMHDALVQLPTIRAFSDNDPSMISIFTTPFPAVIAVGTTKTSIARFWVGTGVLEKQNGRYLDRILTPSQVEKLEGIQPEEISTDLVSLKNFSKIKIYDRKLDFVSR